MSSTSEGLGRPTEFTGKEEDFQQWSQKTEAFFAGVMKESKMMLGCSAGQVTEITQELIDLVFLPTATNVDRGVLNLEFVLQKMHAALMHLTSYEANDIDANSRKNPLEAWRRLQNRYDPTTGRRTRNLLLSVRTPREGPNDGNPTCRAATKLKDTLGDEIQPAGLEALPEEQEKHLILNSNRLRTFEDALLEIVTYVETKCGLRIRDSKRSETGAREHSDPLDVNAINSLACGTGKGEGSSGSSSPRDGCFLCGRAHETTLVRGTASENVLVKVPREMDLAALTHFRSMSDGVMHFARNIRTVLSKVLHARAVHPQTHVVVRPRTRKRRAKGMGRPRSSDRFFL